MKWNIQIMTRGQGSVELALEKKTQERLTSIFVLFWHTWFTCTRLFPRMFCSQCAQDHDYVG